MVAAMPRFDSNNIWYGGAGCCICQSNYSNEGAKAGIQGVDLEAEVDNEGGLALCFDCAIQVGRAVGMLNVDQVKEQALELHDVLERAQAAQEQAAADAAQARLDKDTVERLLGSVYTPEPEGPAFGAEVGA